VSTTHNTLENVATRASLHPDLGHDAMRCGSTVSLLNRNKVIASSV
jgi:hypothetical protein